MDDRVCPYVPYSDKEYAKEVGCKWDSDQRVWYCLKSNNNLSMCSEKLGRETIKEERVYLKVPQAYNGKSESLCHWDPYRKEWYCFKSDANLLYVHTVGVIVTSHQKIV